MEELISIVVPVYNVEKYLEKCVQSLINQTYTNIEIILINDGSLDKSGNICDNLSTIDNRISVIHKTNGGLSDARNAGIDASKGEYITFVDSDDYVTEDFCETLYNNLKYNNADVSSIKLRMVRENGELIYAQDEDKNYKEPITTVIYESLDIMKEVLLWKTFKNYACTKLYKKSIFENNKFKVGTNYEDILFNYEVMKTVKKVVYTNKECYFYLKRRDSISATCSEKNLNNFIDIIIYRYKEINNILPEIKEYNVYALVDAINSISIKYNISNNKFKSIDLKSEYIFNELKKYIKNNEGRLLPMLNSLQKASIYLINYDKQLYYNFLRTRQELNTKIR